MRNAAVHLSSTLTLVTEECCNCGVVFAVSNDLQDSWRKTKRTFHCPNGHAQSYTESTAERLQRELDAAKRDVEWQKNRAATLDAQLVKERKAKARLEKRVSCGVCPHCQRTFKQLAAHMKTKHPEALASATAAGAVDPHARSTGKLPTRAKGI